MLALSESDLYSPRKDPDHEIIPNPEMMPKIDPEMIPTPKLPPFFSTLTPK